VYATIKGTVEKKVWKPEAEEQFEDSLGNVLDKKTYEALLRQGLL
jgi:splicing factor 3A subunit 3